MEAIAAFIIALIKALPAAEKIFQRSVDLYFAQQEAAEHERYQKKKATRDAIIAAMTRQGVTDEELKELRRSLYDLNRD